MQVYNEEEQIKQKKKSTGDLNATTKTWAERQAVIATEIRGIREKPSALHWRNRKSLENDPPNLIANLQGECLPERLFPPNKQMLTFTKLLLKWWKGGRVHPTLETRLTVSSTSLGRKEDEKWRVVDFFPMVSESLWGQATCSNGVSV